MSDLSAAAAAMGIPEALVQRSVDARAAEGGASVEELLAAWAGGEAVATAAPAAEPAQAEETADATDESAEVTDGLAALAPPSPAVPADGPPTSGGTQAPAAAQAPAATTPAPVPTEVTPREAARLPEVITVPTAGIRERTSASIPRWLTSLLLAAPLFALFALGGFSTGECGEATELRTDIITGEIVNCDGSQFTGAEGPGTGVDFMSLGGAIYAGTGVTGVTCAGCHGASGQGQANFPGMTGVTTVFSSCTDHIEWVSLGAPGFNAEGRSTYGDTNRPVNQMPRFDGALSEEQIAAVVAYERVAFAGADRDQTAIDCGLEEDPDAEPDEENGLENGEDDDFNGENGEDEAAAPDPSSTS